MKRAALYMRVSTVYRHPENGADELIAGATVFCVGARAAKPAISMHPQNRLAAASFGVQELSIMVEHGSNADTRTDDPARLEFLANWHCI
jgi:hypothetical protein